MASHIFLDKIGGSPFQEFIVEVKSYAGELTILVKPQYLFRMLKMLKEQYEFDYLADITAVDYYTDEERFEVSYNIVNLEGKQRLRIASRIEENNPTVESVVALWPSANWYEREAFDMMGIRFHNHPDLRRIYMPEDFEYFPLRKEFPLLGIPGSIELPEKTERSF